MYTMHEYEFVRQYAERLKQAEVTYQRLQAAIVDDKSSQRSLPVEVLEFTAGCFMWASKTINRQAQLMHAKRAHRV